MRVRARLIGELSNQKTRDALKRRIGSLPEREAEMRFTNVAIVAPTVRRWSMLASPARDRAWDRMCELLGILRDPLGTRRNLTEALPVSRTMRR